MITRYEKPKSFTLPAFEKILVSSLTDHSLKLLEHEIPFSEIIKPIPAKLQPVMFLPKRKRY
jgi:hypothetical protein